MGKVASGATRGFDPTGIVGNAAGSASDRGLATGQQWMGEFSKAAGVGKPYSPNAGAFSPNAQEQDYIQRLQAMAYGAAQSPAQLQMKQGLDQATQQSGALAASARGVSPALAHRLAAMSQAGMAQNVNQNSAILRAQEQQAGMGMLGNELQSVRTGQMAQEGLRANAFENQQQRRSGLIGGALASGGNAAMMMAGGGKFKGGQISGYFDGGATMSPDMEGVPQQTSSKSSAPKQASKEKKQIPSMPQIGPGPLANPMQMPNVVNMQMPQSVIGQKLNGMATGGILAESGGHVPGQAEVRGDSPKNDIVPAMLSPGEIVIPRSILEHEHAGEMAKSFVEGILAGKKKDKFDSGGIAGAGHDMLGIGEENYPESSFTVTPPSGQTQQNFTQDPNNYYLNQQVPNTEMNNIPEPKTPMGGSAQGSAMGGGQFASDIAQYQKDTARQTYDMEQAKFNLRADNDALANDIANNQIDPNKYLHNMSTKDRILNSIGLILGGLGSGLTGKPNLAIDFLNNQIDRDVKAQELNKQNKQNLLHANIERYKSDIDGAHMTKANLLAATKAAIAQKIAGSKDPMVQQRGVEAMAMLDGNIESLLHSVASRQASGQMAAMNGSISSTTDPALLVPMKVPKERQEAVFKEIEDAQNIKSSANEAFEAYDDLVKQLKEIKHFGGAITPEAQNRLEAALVPTIQKIEGTVREFAFESAHRNFIPSAKDMLLGREEGKRKAMENYFNSHSSAPRAKSYGIDLEKFKSTSPYKGPPKIENRGGVPYEKVEGGWKKMK